MVNKTKNAFTLAEVLITLVIIGIVAALTISSVINTYVERSTISKVKKGLSTLAQAKKLAEVQNGSIESWNFGAGPTAENARDFWTYLKPHISVAKDCGSNLDCYQSNGLYTLRGLPYDKNHSTLSEYYKFVLADGGVMWFRMAAGGKCSVTEEDQVPNVCAVFFYDVNGDKRPNAIGRDIFAYTMSADSVYPYMKNDCNKSSTGRGCSGYIIKNSNMKYLH